MRIKTLHRTFYLTKNFSEEDNEYTEFLRRHYRLTWKDILQKKTAVIVGEYGIGKTVEFQNQKERLCNSNEYAFLFELNQISSKEDIEYTNNLNSKKLSQWKTSTELGYFFLDSIDEARLTSHANLKKAVAIIHNELIPHSKRAHIYISSRLSDWAIPEVQDIIKDYLIKPFRHEDNEKQNDLKEYYSDDLSSFVFSLEALSIVEAKKFSEFIGKEKDSYFSNTDFWKAIEDGGHTFMATRPLDLGWMVQLWVQEKKLGTYLELIEANIKNRLIDTNPNYPSTSSIPFSQLISGVERLAAALEFSSTYSISSNLNAATTAGQVSASDILNDWDKEQIRYLLATAIFDEATYGRVKFHHRVTREYLSAKWVNALLANGVMWHQITPLFTATVFGELVLIPTRRSSLCWLATINHTVGQWVTEHFPELFLFDGDQENWSPLLAEKALEKYFNKSHAKIYKDWYLSAAEYRRIGRCISIAYINKKLLKKNLSSIETETLLYCIQHAEIQECTDNVYKIFQNKDVSSKDRLLALGALCKIGNLYHLTRIREQLLNGDFKSNNFILTAFSGIQLSTLSLDEFGDVLRMIQPEKEDVFEPTSYILQEDIINHCNTDEINLLLHAAVDLFSELSDKSPMSDNYDLATFSPKWLLEIIPSCFEKYIEIHNDQTHKYPVHCIHAAKIINNINKSQTYLHIPFERIQSIIKTKQNLRNEIALKFGRSGEPFDLVYHENIVTFNKTDLPKIIEKANSTKIEQIDKNVWFHIAMYIAFFQLEGLEQTNTLNKIIQGPDSLFRKTIVSDFQQRRETAIRREKKYKTEQAIRKKERLAQQQDLITLFKQDLSAIRSGQNFRALRWARSFTQNHHGLRNKVIDLDLIETKFGRDFSEALADGFKAVWDNTEITEILDEQFTDEPQHIIYSQIGLFLTLGNSYNVSSLTLKEVEKAAYLNLRDFHIPIPNFNQLIQAHKEVTIETISKLLESDLFEKPSEIHPIATERALHCSPAQPLLFSNLANSIKKRKPSNLNLLKTILPTLYEYKLITQDEIQDIIKPILTDKQNFEEEAEFFTWLTLWLNLDIQKAWNWFETFLVTLNSKQRKKCLEMFTVENTDLSWVRISEDTRTVEALLIIYNYLEREIIRYNSKKLDQSILTVKNNIPNIVAQFPGQTAHNFLTAISERENTETRNLWIKAKLLQHSANEAQAKSHFSIQELRNLGTPLNIEIKNEEQLFDQAISILEDLKKRVEEGPYSERDLFFLGIPEQYLQLWMAEKFNGIPIKQFAVTREEEVDNKKLTDIQLSCSKGKVCIEIKPLDRLRSYTATHLAEDTLSRQLVGQYLKGYNSSHGILLLFRLDDKAWNIPNGKKRQPFKSLIDYLQTEADKITNSMNESIKLKVIGIDCIIDSP